MLAQALIYSACEQFQIMELASERSVPTRMFDVGHATLCPPYTYCEVDKFVPTMGKYRDALTLLFLQALLSAREAAAMRSQPLKM